MTKRILLTLAALALTIPLTGQMATVVNQFVSAYDVGVAVLVRYVGTNSSATVAVVQGGAMTFQVGGVAYTGFECPVSGALGGIIDTGQTACDTLGEVVDSINGNCTGCSSDFRAVIVDGLRTDSSAFLLARSTSQVTLAGGVPLYQDTSANFDVGETRAVIPPNCRTDIRCFMSPQGKLLENPSGGTQTFVNWIEGYSTYGSGTSTLNVYSVKASNKTAGAETVTTLWSEAMGVTATNKQFSQFQYVPLYSRPHEKMVVRISNSAAQATVRLLVSGQQKGL